MRRDQGLKNFVKKIYVISCIPPPRPSIFIILSSHLHYTRSLLPRINAINGRPLKRRRKNEIFDFFKTKSGISSKIF